MVKKITVLSIADLIDCLMQGRTSGVYKAFQKKLETIFW